MLGLALLGQGPDAPLKLAARAGDAATVARLLAEGAPVNQADEGGNTALISAAYHGRAEVVPLLLRAGADPLVKAASEYTALDYAMERGHRPVVVALCRHWLGLATEGEEARSLGLVLAAAEGAAPTLGDLLKRGAKVDGENRSGYTALAMAVRWGEDELVRQLLAAGADPGRPTRSRYEATPLMESTRDGRTALAKVLLAAGAPVNHRDRHGDHALNWAVYFGHYDLVVLLVKQGSRLDFTGQTPDTALAIALREKHARIVEFLRAAGAK